MSCIVKKGKNFEIRTPVGDLEWVIISGEGKKNKFNGNMEFTATIVLDPKAENVKAILKEIADFWAENKPKGAKKPASDSTYQHKVNTGKTDEDGDAIWEEDGLITIQMKTQTTWPAKGDKPAQEKVIQIFNSKGKEVSIGSKKVGNGSRGVLIGMIKIYDNGGKQGVSIYLNAVQIAKFEEYVGGIEAEELDEEDGWEGTGEELPEIEAQEAASSEGAQPRL